MNPTTSQRKPPAAAVRSVLGLAIRQVQGGPMQQVGSATAQAGAGLVQNARVSAKRGLTFLARQSWDDALRELGADLPWQTRRANVLVSGGSLAEWIGQRIRVGSCVEVDIVGITDPCRVMDEQYAGLRSALVPDARGGVYGRVVQGGEIRLGDSIVVLGCSPAEDRA